MKKLSFRSIGRFNNFLRSDTDVSKKFLLEFNRYMLKFLLENREAFVIKNWLGESFIYSLKDKKIDLDGDLKDVDLISEDMKYQLKDGRVIESQGGYKFLGFYPSNFTIFVCQSDLTDLPFLCESLEYYRENANVYHLSFDKSVRKDMYRLDIERYGKDSLDLRNLFVASSTTILRDMYVEEINVFDNPTEEVS